MKISKSYLRRLILEGLRMNENLMLIEIDSGGAVCFILARNNYKLSTWNKDYFFKSMLGMCKMNDAMSPCNGARAISLGAAEEGYGPTLYDVIMEVTPYPLINDRMEVSDPMQVMMKFYLDNRTDVNKKLLDNMWDPGEYPRTPDTSDDCIPGDGQTYEFGINTKKSIMWEEDPLSYSYNKPLSPRVTQMKTAGDDFLLNVNPNIKELLDVADDFFLIKSEEYEKRQKRMR